MICRISRLQGAGIPILNAVYRFYPFRDCDILRDTASRSELSRRRRVTFKRVVGIEDDDALDRLVVCGSSVRHTRPGSPGCSGCRTRGVDRRGGRSIRSGHHDRSAGAPGTGKRGSQGKRAVRFGASGNDRGFFGRGDAAAEKLYSLPAFSERTSGNVKIGQRKFLPLSDHTDARLTA